MQKKVGLVTCYFKDNYGSMLQAYATKIFLDKNNILNETINIDNNIDFKKGKRKFYLTQILNFDFIRTKLGMIKLKFRKKFKKNLGKNIDIRNKKYEEFRKEFNLTASYQTYGELTELADKRYSDVIVGSDQLWLPVNVVADYYTLNWVPDCVNKISYSTSFGVSSVSKKYKDLYKKFLKNINHISIREESGIKLAKEIADIDAKLVCDPTILLTKDEWEKVAAKENIIKEKYILCYFLGKNIEHRKFAERLKEKTGYKIVSLNHADEYVKYSDKFADYMPYDVGPREWITLIKDAEYVCTDSFHGTVFSILFNKIFFDFRRFNSKNKNNTNSRLDSLLKIAGISNDRILTGKECIEDVLNYKIIYKDVNDNINKFRKDSVVWLLNSLDYKKEKTNENFIKIEDKELCTGCTACYSVCPKNAIKMVRDEEGFLYPKVDNEKCVNCGLCKKVCPVLNKKEKEEYTQKAFLFQNSNEVVRQDSTSGGFYTALGKYVIENNGIVYGATFNEDFIVEHKCADDISGLIKFRKSKYVQSDLNDTFKKIKKELDKNKLVCFSGTPCQVEGLNSFLNRKYDNLILVDIMCHSVPSPLFFKKYKKYILNKMNANKIISINFRDKAKYGYKYSMMTIETDNGKYSEGIDTDPYLRAFFGDYSVRPSCYNCRFKTQERVSDITIWDCFNVHEIDKSFDDDKGTTRLLVQSEKGLKILKKLEMCKLKEIDTSIAIKNVNEMTKSVKSNINRKNFFERIDDEDMIDDFFPVNLKTRLNSFIRKFLSITGVYDVTKRFLKKVLKK